MKAERLISMVLLLQVRRRILARELAARFEVSERTILRDVVSLSAAGVPVYCERGRHGGIRLLDGFRATRAGLTEAEVRALVLTAPADPTGRPTARDAALHKLMLALPAAGREAADAARRLVIVDPEPWFAPSAPSGPVDEVHRAVFAGRRLRIGYRSSGDAASSTRTVDPYGLVAKAGAWYLVADDRGRPRLFRLSRMTTATMLDQPARRRPVELVGLWSKLSSRLEAPGEAVTVRGRLRSDRLDLFLRIVGSRCIDHRPGRAGDTSVTLRYPEIAGVRQLLQFGPQLVVTDPPEARALLGQLAEEVSALYR